MNKIKILYIFCSQNYSGAEIVLERLILANLDRVTPTVLCPPGEFAERLKKQGIEVREEKALLSLERGKIKYSKRKLFRILVINFSKITFRVTALLREQFSIVHANNLSPAFYLLPSLLLNKLIRRKTKWIWSNHDLTYPDGKKGERLAQVCHKYYDLTLAVSEAVKLKYQRYSDKIRVLHNGLNTNQFCFNEGERIKFRAQYNIPAGSNLLGIVGMISERKGHHILLTAYQKLLKDFPDSILLIIGRFSSVEANYEKYIKETINNLPQGRVILLEPRSDIENVYSALDILINASISELSEPLGTTIYEAMACERIVVASNTGGTPEIIDNGINGLLFTPNNSEDLFDKLKYTIRNNNDLDGVRKAARKKVELSFSIQQMTSNYNDILFSNS